MILFWKTVVNNVEFVLQEGLLLIDLVDKFGTEFIIFTVIVIEVKRPYSCQSLRV